MSSINEPDILPANSSLESVKGTARDVKKPSVLMLVVIHFKR